MTSFFEGLKYFEIAQLEIRDVRLVYAPAEGIGVFGGETDNWRWPRHTGDWSFLRAYVGKDGKPAAYSKDNVPYKPAHWLKVSAQGAKPGELVFVVGYPGRTMRHRTYAEIKETTEWALPRSVRLARGAARAHREADGQQQGHGHQAGRADPGPQQRPDQQQGRARGAGEGRRARAEGKRRRRRWWRGSPPTPARQKQYGDVLPALAALQAEGEKVRERNAVLGSLSSASQYLERRADPVSAVGRSGRRATSTATRATRSATGAASARAWTGCSARSTPPADRAFLRWAMGLAAALPADQRIEPLDKVVGLRAGLAGRRGRAARSTRTSTSSTPGRRSATGTSAWP